MKHTKTETFSANQRIITQGKKSDKAYMITSGRVRIFLENNGKTVELAQLGENEIFGESAILSNESYGANVETLENTTLQIITKASLDEMIDDADPILRALTQMLITRLKSTNEALLNSETREFMDIALI